MRSHDDICHLRSWRSSLDVKDDTALFAAFMRNVQTTDSIYDFYCSVAYKEYDNRRQNRAKRQWRRWITTDNTDKTHKQTHEDMWSFPHIDHHKHHEVHSAALHRQSTPWYRLVLGHHSFLFFSSSLIIPQLPSHHIARQCSMWIGPGCSWLTTPPSNEHGVVIDTKRERERMTYRVIECILWWMKM